MANRYYDNSDEGQRFQPGTTAEAGAVEAKFDAVQTAFDGVQADTDRSLKLPDEGTSQALTESALDRRNKVVGFDANGDLVLTGGFTWRGNWAADTEYFVNDVFRDAATKNLYVVQERHTSVTLADDISAGKSELAINVVDVENAKTAAEAARDTTQTARDTTLASRDTTLAARDKAEQWAEEPEDIAVEPGAYSALHHKAKAQQAQSASETARDASQTAKGLSEQARDASQNARDLSQQYRDTALSHRDDAQAARDKAESWADEPEDVEVEAGKYSARHWAGKAAESMADGVIDDSTTALDKAWSSQKVSDELGGKRDFSDDTYQMQRYDLAVNDTYSANATTDVDLDLSTGPQVAIVGNASLRTVNLNNPPTDRSMLVIVYATGSAGLSFAQLPSASYWDGGEVPAAGDVWTQYLLWWTGTAWRGTVGVKR